MDHTPTDTLAKRSKSTNGGLSSATMADLRPKQILLLYLKTGGGHLAPARSIANFMQRELSDLVTPELVDGLAEAPSAIRHILEDGYRLLQARARHAYSALYLLNKVRPLAKLTRNLVSRFVSPYLEKRILATRPDKIVVLHFFLIQPVLEIVRRHHLKIQVVTLVTDPYTAHPIWFAETSTQFIVFSRAVKNTAIASGVSPENVSILPFPVDEKYSSPLRTLQIRKIKEGLGIGEGRKVILMLGGADGLPGCDSILRRLLADRAEAEIIVVCGKNGSLERRLLNFVRIENLKNVRVFGYIDFVYELLNAADIVITKCGASTLMEALLLRKIPVVNSYLWEQEKGNVDLIRDKYVGIYETNTGRLVQYVRSLLTESPLRSAMLRNLEDLNLINGTETVSRYICQDARVSVHA